MVLLLMAVVPVVVLVSLHLPHLVPVSVEWILRRVDGAQGAA